MVEMLLLIRSIGGRHVRGKGPGGFTLIEIMIVVVLLGILAAAVMPQFSNASLQSREAALKDNLRVMRTSIQVFRGHHEDVCPGYANGDENSAPSEASLVAQLTGRTDVSGAVAVPPVVGTFGPYMGKMTVNTINGLNSVLMVGNGQPMPAADNSTGWQYKAETGEFRANSTGTDREGVAYSSYYRRPMAAHRRDDRKPDRR